MYMQMNLHNYVHVLNLHYPSTKLYVNNENVSRFTYIHVDMFSKQIDYHVILYSNGDQLIG